MYQINVLEREESNGVVKTMKFLICFSVATFSLVSQRYVQQKGTRGVNKLVLRLLIQL